MNREIKFRGQREDTGEWVYGSLIVEYSNKGVLTYIALEHAKVDLLDDHNMRIEFMYEVDPKTVCQYVGVKDRYDQEIYEGDIVKIPVKNAFGVMGEVRGVVKYEDLKYVLKECAVKQHNGKVEKQATWYISSKDLEKAEILGNIWDEELIGRDNYGYDS